jgi:hypothetical protein
MSNSIQGSIPSGSIPLATDWTQDEKVKNATLADKGYKPVDDLWNLSSDDLRVGGNTKGANDPATVLANIKSLVGNYDAAIHSKSISGPLINENDLNDVTKTQLQDVENYLEAPAPAAATEHTSGISRHYVPGTREDAPI